MRPIPPGGVLLLDAGEAAGLLGSEDRLRLCEHRGFITAMDTPLGPRYREDELLELRRAWDAGPALRGRLRPGQAAYVLGVSPETLRNSPWGRTLTRDDQGCYDADEIRAVKAGRDARHRDARERRERRIWRERETAKRRRRAARMPA